MGALDGRTALVTGSARGLGEAMARLFHREGACVVIADILDEAGEAVAKELGERASYVHLDVRVERDWRQAIGRAEELFDPLTVLVNNAAILVRGGVLDTTSEGFNDMVQVNVWGALLGMQCVVPTMRSAGGGSIINVSSTGGLIGQGTAVAYTATKFAMRGLTKSAALDLAPDIRVNSLHPAWPATTMTAKAGLTDEEKERRLRPLFAMRRPSQPGEIANAALFLASSSSSYMTGSELVVDGGRTAGTPPPEARKR